MQFQFHVLRSALAEAGVMVSRRRGAIVIFEVPDEEEPYVVYAPSDDSLLELRFILQDLWKYSEPLTRRLVEVLASRLIENEFESG